MLRLKNIRASYTTTRGTVTAVDNVSLEVRRNEILGIAGESGCGKSTLIKIIYGYVERPLSVTAGTLEAEMEEENGQIIPLDLTNLRKYWWRYISYIPQGSMSVLNPVIRVENQFFDAVTRFHQVANRKILRQQIADYLRELELPVEVLRSFPHQLSGGMRQRVLVAMATFLQPQIILADEPTTALDVVVQRGILTMLTRVQQQMENTLVLVSHDMGVHYQITNRLAIMYAAKLVEVGPTDGIFTRPLHPYTDLLIKSLPRLGDERQREGIRGAPPSLFNPPAGCRFAARCPAVMEVCRHQEPPLREVQPDHYVACHLHDPSVVSANGAAQVQEAI